MAALTAYTVFFPQWQEYYSNILATQCQDQYKNFTLGVDNGPAIGDERQSLISPVISCLLEKTDPGIAANTAAAAVLLGLLPTILLSAGTITMQNNFLLLKRPLLGLMLTMSCPAVAMISAEDYGQPELVLKGAPVVLASIRQGVARLTVLVVEYMLAIFAVFNIGHLIWILTVRTTLSWSYSFHWTVVLWLLVPLGVQALSLTALRLRLRLDEGVKKNWLLRGLESKSEFPIGTRVLLKQENFAFYAFSWVASTLALLHLTYGSVVLAGLLFIGAKDAVLIALRFFGSVMAAKAILAYELGGMRSSVLFEPRGSVVELVETGLTVKGSS